MLSDAERPRSTEFRRERPICKNLCRCYKEIFWKQFGLEVKSGLEWISSLTFRGKVADLKILPHNNGWIFFFFLRKKRNFFAWKREIIFYSGEAGNRFSVYEFLTDRVWESKSNVPPSKPKQLAITFTLKLFTKFPYVRLPFLVAVNTTPKAFHYYFIFHHEGKERPELHQKP